MLKRVFSLLFCSVLVLSLWAGGKAKSVFYFIGDGMGVNQVNLTETYLAALEGRIGIVPLTFADFPYAGLINTFSATNGVTDSAASGTALATGRKTKNHALGLLPDLTTPAMSIAVGAKAAGARVGIATSVSVDHATPAAFYAHVPDRNSYHKIGGQLIDAGFDFYAGSDFRQPAADKAAGETQSLFERASSEGYAIVRGYDNYVKASPSADRLILLQPEQPSNADRTCLPYAIDRRESDLTLTQITRAAIDRLSGSKQGFFLMVEGGKIDYACHANDAAAVVHEVIDMDNAIREAFAFYEKHPKETLIVVTADHETGGLVLGRGPYELHTDLLRHQRMSAEEYTRHLNRLHADLGDKLTWERMEADLRENWGFGASVSLNDHQKERLHKAFDEFIAGRDKAKTNLYASLGGIADAARRTMAECALIGWQSGGHSNGYVPVFAVGVGAEQFVGRFDNTLIPAKIAAIAGWSVK